MAADLSVAIALVGKDEFSPAAQQATGALNALGERATAVGNVLAVGLGAAAAGVAGGLGFAAKAAMDYEKTLSGVKAVSGATAGEMAQVSSLALQLGKDTAFSASQAAAGMEELVKGGLSIPDIMNGAAKSTLALAAAGGVSLPEAATIAANALAQFNLKGQDMARVADLIAGAANASAIDVGQFKLSLQAAGAVASTVGFSFDDLAQAIAVMGKAGIAGSDAGTSLKTMMLNLQPSTKAQFAEFERLGLGTLNTAKAMDILTNKLLATEQGQNALNKRQKDGSVTAETLYKEAEKLGLVARDVEFNKWAADTGLVGNAFFDASGKVKNMAEVAGILQNATKDLTEQQRLSSLAILFGSDAIRAAAVLSKEGAAGFEAMAGAMGKVTAESVSAERLNNLAGDLEQMKGSAETAAIVLGQTFQPALRSGAQAVTALINAALPFVETQGPKFVALVTDAADTVRNLDRVLGNAQNVIQANSGSVSVLTGLVGAGTAAWGLMTAAAIAHAIQTQAVIVATQAQTVAQTALNVVMTANPIGLVVVAIAGLVAAFVTAYNTSEDFRNTVDGAMAGARAAIEALGTGAQTTFGALSETVTGAMQTVSTTLSQGWRTAQDTVTEAQNAIQGTVNRVWDAIPPDIRADLDLIGSHLTTKTGEFLGTMNASGQAILSDARATWDSATAKVQESWAAIGVATQTALYGEKGKGGIVPGVAAAWTTIKDSVSTKLGETFEVFKTWASDVLKRLGELGTEFGKAAESVGTAIVDGIKAGILSAGQALGEAAAQAARAALDAAKRALGVPGAGGMGPGGSAPSGTAEARPASGSGAWGMLVPGGQGVATDQGTHGGWPAVDIFAPRGTPILAPVSGTSSPGTYPLGGNATTLIGANGKAYYFAHALGPMLGGPVAAGQQIGQVGNSGNAASTPPHLHFAAATSADLFNRFNGSGNLWPNSPTRGFLQGGWLTEPIVGLGLQSGAGYRFVEDGRPERVLSHGEATAGGGTTIVVNVQGSVTSERDLVEAIRQGLLRDGERNGRRGALA